MGSFQSLEQGLTPSKVCGQKNCAPLSCGEGYSICKTQTRTWGDALEEMFPISFMS